MSIQVTDKYQYFKDTDGTPLDNGYIYIGTAGFSPQSSPITAYLDAAMTMPIAQPIRTSGGYMVNNGTPVNVYTAADFSITVLDKNSGTVYASLSGNIDYIVASAQEQVALAEAEVALAEAQVALAEQAVIDASAAAQAVYDANIEVGTYTPTIYLASATNITSATASVSRYIKTGGIVTAYIRISITPTSAGACSLPFLPPIAASTFADEEKTTGHGSTGSDAGGTQAPLYIYRFSSTTPMIRFVATNTTATYAIFTLSYSLV